MKAKKEKKKITLREYHKKRMVTGIAILVTEIFENTVEHYKLDNTTWATVIFVVLAAMTALFAVIWLYASCQKVDILFPPFRILKSLFTAAFSPCELTTLSIIQQLFTIVNSQNVEFLIYIPHSL